MKRKTLLIYTETPLHIGCGKDIGAVDMPVARERISGQPIIPGSGLKGSLRSNFEMFGCAPSTINDLFGAEDDGTPTDDGNKTSPGGIIFSDARLAFLPIRAPKGGFSLTTSPSCIARFARSLGYPFDPFEIKDGECLAEGAHVVGNNVVLEDCCFVKSGGLPEILGEILRGGLKTLFFKMAAKK